MGSEDCSLLTAISTFNGRSSTYQPLRRGTTVHTHKRQLPKNVTFCFTSAGLVIQSPPQQDGVHELPLRLGPVEGLGEREVGHLRQREWSAQLVQEG